MITTKCLECGIEIKTYLSRLGRKKYCSRSCRAKNCPNLFKLGHKTNSGKPRKGGVYHHSSGYTHIYSANHPHKDCRGYVPEHILIMEKSIGRFIVSPEVVHHKNRIKNDNRIENLQLFKNNSEHIKQAHKDLGISTRFKNSNL